MTSLGFLIMLTCSCYVDPCQAQLLYKTGFYRVNIVFIIVPAKHRLWVVVTTASNIEFGHW